MTERMGVIGYPLGHTLSPAFQRAGLETAGVDATFDAWPTPPEDLAGKVGGFRDPDVLGVCVTLPHKQAVIPLLDELEPAAKEIGAVNWIVNREGRLVGHNTDAPGFIRALREELRFDPEGANALILGAGGAARAVVFALRDAGVKRMTVGNRTVEKATQLAEIASRDGGLEARGIGMDRDALSEAATTADLLVNTTSIGMTGGPAPEASPIPEDLINERMAVYDIVYAPPVTPLLQAASARGARGATGLSMLVYQGVIGFERCTGVQAPAEVMIAAARRARAGDG